MRSVEKPLSSGESVLIPRKGSLNHVMYVDEDFWTVDTMFFTIPRMPGAAKYAYQYVKGLNLASMNAGSAVPSMTVDILNGLQLAIPCKEALAELDSELQPTYSLIAQIRAESKVLVELRDSLLPKLMSGEIDTSKIDLTQLNSHLSDHSVAIREINNSTIAETTFINRSIALRMLFEKLSHGIRHAFDILG